MSLTTALTDNNKPLAVLRKTEMPALIANVSACVIETLSIYKVDEAKNLTDEEIRFVARTIIVDYYFLKFTDLIQFVNLCKRGKFGKIYGSLDTATFFQFLDAFCDARSTKSAIGHTITHEATKEPMSEKTKEMLNEFFANQRKKQIKESTPQIEGNDIVKDWIEDFKKQVGNLTGFIDFDGKKLNVNEYLESRLKDYQKDN